MALILVGSPHGQFTQTKTGYIQKVLTEDDLVTVYSKDPSVFQANDKGLVNIKVNAKDNFLFAAK
jgi:hypothetical protein